MDGTKALVANRFLCQYTIVSRQKHPFSQKTKCCPFPIAPEQKARLTYDNILRLSDDPDVNNVIRFLREREIVHFQRFGEAIELAKQKLDQKNVYYMNPAFDK